MSSKQPDIFVIRPLEAGDIAAISGWLEDLDDLAVFDRTARVPLNLAALEKVWADCIGNAPGSSSYWFTIDDSNGAAIGVIGLDSINMINRDAILPVFISRDARHQGVGIRAASLIIDIAFFQIGLNRLTSFYRYDNETTRHLTERAGFVEEGRVREAWYHNGRFVDMIAIGMLRKEWLETRKTLASELDEGKQVVFGRNSTGGWRWPPSGKGEDDRRTG